MRQQLIIGEETIDQIRILFSENKWDKVLLVTGKHSYKTSGAERFIGKCLHGFNIVAPRFCDFANNPNITDLNKGLALTKGLSPSVIIAIGGGSVLDMGKLLRFFHTHDGETLSGHYNSNSNEIPLIAIPTTAGTGAEATHFAVLYDEQGKKHSIANEAILPDYAVIYPELTYNQTRYVTACSGFDALAQAIEAYWNKNATSESDEYALKAMNLIFPSLPIAVNNPTKWARDNMAEGAYWAGRAINITKTTAPHAFSYPFTSHYGIPHGHAVALVFPAISHFNLSSGNIPQEKNDFIENFFGHKDNFYQSMLDFTKSLGLSLPLNNYDLQLLLRGINLERLSNNPIAICESDSLKLLEQAINPFKYRNILK